MSNYQSTSPLARSFSDVSQAELQAILRDARRLRAEAFATVFRAIGRFFSAPFRRREDLPNPDVAAMVR